MGRIDLDGGGADDRLQSVSDFGPFQEDIDRFILYLATEKGLSTAYQLSTRRSLEGFAGWAVRERISGWETVGLDHLTQHLAERKKDGLASTSIRLLVIALKIFYRFLELRGRVPKDHAEALLAPKISGYLPETLNEMEAAHFIESISTERPLGLRDRAMLELLYSSGLRVSELVRARLERLHLEEGEGFIRVTGKGNKTRLIPVGSSAREALEAYLKIERPRLIKSHTSSEIFLSIRGRPLTTVRVWQICKERARQADIGINIYPHLMRHSFATHLLSNGADLRIIQELLGHADIATTQVYTHVDNVGLKSVHHRFHPRG